MDANLSSRPLILTLRLDDATFDVLDALRRQFFPPERNFIPAHLTLFHALPGERTQMLHEVLYAHCASLTPIPLSLPRVRFLGRGVAAEVESMELLNLRRDLAEKWRPHLTAQDGQKFRPHVTLQNKVSPEKARTLYEQLNGEWISRSARGEGLLLWRYLGGPWELVQGFSFGGPGSTGKKE